MTSQTPRLPRDEPSDRRRGHDHHHDRSRSRSPKRQRQDGAAPSRKGDDEYRPRDHPHRDSRSHGKDSDTRESGRLGGHRDGERRHRHHHHHHHHRQPEGEAATSDKPLPFGSRALNRKQDFAAFEGLFGYYLDLHKNLDIGEMTEDEIRGRWKSFVGKWNRGGLAEGWYDPGLFERVGRGEEGGGEFEEDMEGEGGEGKEIVMGMDEFGRVRGRDDEDGGGEGRLRSPGVGRDGERGGSSKRDGGEKLDVEMGIEGQDSEDDDNYGPSLPPTAREYRQQHGAGTPTLEDLNLRREMDRESRMESRQEEIESLRYARKADRRLQKEQLDELVPRADAGTRERKLEKKKLVNEKLRAFREPSPGAAEVPEADLLGDGEDSLAEQKRHLAMQQVKVSERQMRRDEIERAKAAEREERIREFREREERTVESLRELARRRFGGGKGQ